jgi:hypothetical protein
MGGEDGAGEVGMELCGCISLDRRIGQCALNSCPEYMCRRANRFPRINGSTLI